MYMVEYFVVKNSDKYANFEACIIEFPKCSKRIKDMLQSAGKSGNYTIEINDLKDKFDILYKNEW